jgi:hypothetical protein
MHRVALYPLAFDGSSHRPNERGAPSDRILRAMYRPGAVPPSRQPNVCSRGSACCARPEALHRLSDNGKQTLSVAENSSRTGHHTVRHLVAVCLSPMAPS